MKTTRLCVLFKLNHDWRVNFLPNESQHAAKLPSKLIYDRPLKRSATLNRWSTQLMSASATCASKPVDMLRAVENQSKCSPYRASHRFNKSRFWSLVNISQPLLRFIAVSLWAFYFLINYSANFVEWFLSSRIGGHSTPKSANPSIIFVLFPSQTSRFIIRSYLIERIICNEPSCFFVCVYVKCMWVDWVCAVLFWSNAVQRLPSFILFPWMSEETQRRRTRGQ